MSLIAKGKYQELTHDELVRELKKPVLYEIIGNEKELEENIIENINEICQVLGLPEIFMLERQKTIKTVGFFIRPDILIRHVDGSMTVLEVKKASCKHPSTGTANQMSAIGQLLLYKNVLEAIINDHVRVALIDNKIYHRTYLAFGSYKPPITLLELQKDRLLVAYNAWGCS